MNLLLEVVFYLFIGFASGAINSLSGGGSLLTLPLLIFSGLEPSVANGTNRIAVFIQSLFSVAGYQSKKVSCYPLAWYLGLASLIGTLIGVQLAVDIKGDIFNKILVVIMFLVVGSIIFKKKKKDGNVKEKLHGKHLWLSILSFFGIGIYGGFIQAGAGFIVILALTGINGLSLLKSNSVKSFVIGFYTLFAIAMFAYYGKIDWGYGLLLSVGGAFGSWIASRWSVKKGEGIVKLFLVLMVLILGVKLWFFD